MALDLQPWRERAPGLARQRSPFRTQVEVERDAELAARVTLDQLELIASAGIEAVRLRSGGGASRAYGRWDDAPAWPEFFGRARASGGVSAAQAGGR